MKAFIITMSESTHSMNLASDCIIAAKQFNIDVSVWPAVNGLTAADKFQEYKIPKLLHNSMQRAGNQGCFLSHFQLWQHCVELNEPILILEHDGVIIREIPQNINEQYIDVLNLDPYDQSGDTYDQMVNDSITSPVDYYYIPRRKRNLAGEYLPGAYGYLIKPHAALKLINFAQTVGALPTDKHIGRDVVDLKSTTVPLVRLHKFYSTHSIRKFSSTKNLEGFINQ